ncbi:hypothetical protein [Paractinoplanes lichenicola]|uniref:Uncharacterized protein n=1 Tax=Paractinoplanes lichenicola TaxID=2802976 RepID=A0ABS1W121_9ACTN|nr:hypothetical protein [Actinoplanes lichenicola]MBL7260434.1 hypothetical protein [Actinoplanes lichenicola]
MDRGPLALFGAIVAVGLGPALWMGVQLGAIDGDSPVRPPVVREQGTTEKTGQELLGGTGAGEQTGTSPATEPRGHVIPLTTSPSAKPSPSASSEPAPSTTSPAAEPTTTTKTPSYPPTESTTEPTSEPSETGETTEPPVDEETSPPATPGDDVPDEDGTYAGFAGERSGK